MWALFQKGVSPVDIAKKLKTTRQNVHQILKVSETKVSEALLGVVSSNGLEIKSLDLARGILLGYNPLLSRNVVVTYTTRNGVRVWYWYDKPEEVQDSQLLSEAREYLFNEAEERGLRLTAEEKKKHPAILARIIFNKLLPGVRA